MKNRLKIKKIICNNLIIFLISLILLFSSCQNSVGPEIKRINLFNIKYSQNENINQNEVYPKDYFSYIFYRKYYIYFFDDSSKTLYKYSRNGDAVLTIQNSSLTSSGFGVDKEKIMASIDENQRSLKINRTFPLPEVTGISVDFNDNIYFKIVIKGTTGNVSSDCSGFLSNYSDNSHPVYYIFNENNSKEIIEKLDYFEEISKKQSSEEINQINYYTFYMVFNQYGDFLKILAFTENHPSFPHNSMIFHTKEDLSEGSNKDGKKIDGTNYISFILPTIYENSGLPSALANTTSLAFLIKFSLKTSIEKTPIIDLPQQLDVITTIDSRDKIEEDKTKEDKTQNRQENNQEISQIYSFPFQFCQNAVYAFFNLIDLKIPEDNKNLLSSEFGNTIVTPDGFIGIQIYYYEKGYILYDSMYKVDLNNKKNKISLYSYKKLFNEKVEDGVQKITLSVADTFLGSAEGNFVFYIRYLEKLPTPTAKLIIKNEKGEQLLARILKVKDIISSTHMIVGENGSIYGFYKNKDKIHFFYYASEVAINKIKISN